MLFARKDRMGSRCMGPASQECRELKATNRECHSVTFAAMTKAGMRILAICIKWTRRVMESERLWNQAKFHVGKRYSFQRLDQLKNVCCSTQVSKQHNSQFGHQCSNLLDIPLSKEWRDLYATWRAPGTNGGKLMGAEIILWGAAAEGILPTHLDGQQWMKRKTMWSLICIQIFHTYQHRRQD